MPKPAIKAAALPIPIEALEDCGVALGRRGAGKSNALMVLFEHELDAGHRCGMVDPKGDRYGVAMNPDGTPSRFRTGENQLYIFGGAHADVKISPDMGATLAKTIAAHSFPFLIDLSGTLDEPWSLGDQQRFMLDFSSTLYRHNRNPLTLFIEEVDQFANQDQRYQPPRLVHHIANLASLGRQRGLIVWFASQRAAKVNKNLLNMIDTMVALAVRAPLDRDTYQDWFKSHSPEAGKRVLAEVGHFTPGEAFVWVGATGFFEKVAFPVATTFDSGRRPKHGEVVEAVKLAKIELGDLRSAIEQAGMEEVEEVDPKVLIAKDGEIARLTARVEVLETTNTGLLHDVAERDTRLAAIVKLPRYLDARGVMAAVVTDAGKGLDKLDSIIAELNGTPKAEADGQPAAAAPQEPPHRATPPAREAAASSAPRPAATPPVAASGHVPTGPQMKILQAIRDAEVLFKKTEVDRTILGWLSDASPKSSGYQNNLGALRTAGLISYPSKGTCALSAEGFALTTAPVARTLGELLDAICSKVPRPALQPMLRAVVGAGSAGISRADLAEHLGKSASSSGFQNDLGALRSLGTIDYPQPGEVRAAGYLLGE